VCRMDKGRKARQQVMSRCEAPSAFVQLHATLGKEFRRPGQPQKWRRSWWRFASRSQNFWHERSIWTPPASVAHHESAGEPQCDCNKPADV
jgi:hypothetical protein